MGSLHGKASVSPHTPACVWRRNRCPCLLTDDSHWKIWWWWGMGRKCLSWPQWQGSYCHSSVSRERTAQWAVISLPSIYLEIFKSRWDAWKLMQKVYINKSHLVRYKHILAFPFSWPNAALSPGRAAKSSWWFTPPSGFHRHPAWRLSSHVLPSPSGA